MRIRTGAWIAIVIASCLLCAASASARIITWGHGSWSWFGDPRAVYVRELSSGTTFVGWIDWSGHVTIGAYDPRFGLMRTHVVGEEFHDDHSTPSILVEPDQRLTVFWSGHNGRVLRYRTTDRPLDISAWGRTGHVNSAVRGPDGFTYPNPVLLPAEGDRLYLFWRGRDYSQDYATRTLAGRWSPSRRLISAPGQRPYVKVDSNGRDTIVFAYTNGHPRERITSVYFAEYRHGWLRHADGRLIARIGAGAIAPSRGDLVYDGPANHRTSGWVWDVAIDRQGRPVIVYATFQKVSNHEYWYADWDGRRWVSHFLTFGGPTISPRTIEKQYSGGIALDHADPSIVYLSRKAGSGWEIQRWTTSNGGYSLRHRTVVAADGLDNVRPVVPRGGGPVRLVWLRGNYRSYTTYRTSIAFLTGP
jgi:hypothetical protein